MPLPLVNLARRFYLYPDPPPPLATMLFVIQAHRNPCGRMNSPVSLIALGFLNA